jgi:hypothetical protein
VLRTLRALAAGDVATATELVHPDVLWPSSLTPDTIHGRDEFREYWSRRFSVVQVRCEPVRFERSNGSLMVEVHELVLDRNGKMSYGQFRARREFRFRDGLIAEMRLRRWNA